LYPEISSSFTKYFDCNICLPVMAQFHPGVLCKDGINGKSMYVEGRRAWEIEKNLDRLEPQWLGKEPSRTLAKGQEALGDGMGWIR
jgi:hypothetical protein